MSSTSYIDENGNSFVVEMNDRKEYEILENPLRLSEIGNSENFCKVEDEEELYEIINDHSNYRTTPENWNEVNEVWSF